MVLDLLERLLTFRFIVLDIIVIVIVLLFAVEELEVLLEVVDNLVLKNARQVVSTRG